MTETKQEYVQPIRTNPADFVDPFEFEANGKIYKAYVDKRGYQWEINGKSGVAEMVNVSIAKLDMNGDISGNKKSINIPAGISDADLSKLFDSIVVVKDKPLRNQEENKGDQ